MKASDFERKFDEGEDVTAVWIAERLERKVS